MRYIFTILVLLFIGCGDNNTTNSSKKIDENSSKSDINISQEENSTIEYSSPITDIVTDNNDTNNTLVDNNISTEDEVSGSEEEESETPPSNSTYSETGSSTPTTNSSPSETGGDSSSNSSGNSSETGSGSSSTTNSTPSETDSSSTSTTNSTPSETGNSSTSTTNSNSSTRDNSSSNSSTEEDNNSTTVEDSNSTTEDDNTTTTEEENSTTQSETGGNSTSRTNTSSSTGDNSSSNSTTEEDNTTTTEDSNSTAEDDNTTTTEDSNSTAEDDNTTTTTEDSNSTAEDDNTTTTTEDSNSTAEDDNTTTTTEDSNSTAEDDNTTTTTEDSNSTAEDDNTTTTEDNNSTAEDDNTTTTTEDSNSTSEDNNTTTTEDNNSTAEDENTTTNDNTILGKAQLGVIADANVTIYEVNGTERTIIATEKTSSGDSIESIGNFRLHLAELNESKLYIYEVSGGDDWDVDDNGIINDTPTPNRGTFHLIARGDTLRSAKKLNITIVSEIIYQKVKPYIGEDTLYDKLDSSSKEIIEDDINDDSSIDIDDVLSYDPVSHPQRLSSIYETQLKSMVNNVLNNRDINYTEPIEPVVTPLTEADIQEALDDGNYDYVISQLTEDKELYDLNDDEVNMNIAGAYVGKSGYTVFDITSAIDDSGDSLNGFVSETTKDNDAVETIEQLKKADDYYSSVIDGVDCSDSDSLTEEQKSSCFNLGLVRLTSLSNSVKLLFGGDADIVKSWANGVETNSSDDLNGNGVIDESDASACAIVYADNPNNNCRDGSMATYRKKVTFTDGETAYNTTMIDVDVGSSKLGYRTFNRLVTNKSSDNSALLTDGVCDINFNKTTNSVDGVTYFPCPIVNNGELMNIADSLASTSNIQSLFPPESETRETIDSYIENITGSKDGVINQNNLSLYLQSH